MSKKRRIEGSPKEILYFAAESLPVKALEDNEIISRIREKPASHNISLLEFNTERGTLGIINESPKEISLKEMYAIFDALELRVIYTKSEFV